MTTTVWPALRAGFATAHRTRQGRRWFFSILWAILLVTASAFVSRPLTRNLDTARIGGLSGNQFEAGVNWVLCGRYAHQPYRGTSGTDFSLINPSSYDDSPRTMIRREVGSIAAYCALPAAPREMEEISMMWVDALALRLLPDASLKAIARLLAVMRLALIALFALYLMRSGWSLLIGGLVTASAVYLTMLQGGNALYTSYPFILPVLLATVGGAGLILGSQRPWLVLAGAAALGASAVFLGNLRTSHYPEGLAAIAVFIGFATRWTAPGRQRAAWIAAATAAAFSGGLLFQAGFLSPVRRQQVAGYTYHTIAHPLVLGLALPANDLARREGIKWEDGAGGVLAQRIDPSAVYLGHNYERSLFTYYRQLWRDHPGEMAGIYRRKLWTTTEDMFKFLHSTAPDAFWDGKDGRYLAAAAVPVEIASRFLTLGGCFLALLAIGLFLCRAWRSDAAYLVIMIGVIGCLSFAEAVIILGGVVLWYTPALVFATVCTGLFPFELLLDYLARPSEQQLSPRESRSTQPLTA